MKKKDAKPLKVKTKQIDKDLNKAYKKNLGGDNLKKNKKMEKNEVNKNNIEVQEEINSTNNTQENNTTQNGNDELENLKNENEKLKDLLARKSAELDNIIKRTLKEKNDLIEYANESLLLKFLPLLDDFAKALEAAKNSKDYDSLLKGIEMIYEKAVKTFSEAGVNKMEIKPGDEFNVDFHEALMQIPSEEIDDGKIVQIAEDGYMLKDKVLRHAKVITSSGNNQE